MSAPNSAMVLAAGLGTRMRPLTNDRPKPLIEVAGRTLVDRSLDRVEEIGVNLAVVNLHYLPEMLRSHLAGRSTPTIKFSDEIDELLETGGGIVKALPLLGEDPFVVVNSDNVWIGENALSPLVEAWRPEVMDVLLLLVPVEKTVGYTRSGDFELDSEARLVRRGDQPTASFVFSGAQIIKPDVFANAPDGPFSLNIVWDEIIASGRAFGAVHDGGWCDVGTPDGLRLAEAAVKAG